MPIKYRKEEITFYKTDSGQSIDIEEAIKMERMHQIRNFLEDSNLFNSAPIGPNILVAFMEENSKKIIDLLFNIEESIEIKDD